MEDGDGGTRLIDVEKEEKGSRCPSAAPTIQTPPDQRGRLVLASVVRRQTACVKLT